MVNVPKPFRRTVRLFNRCIRIVDIKLRITFCTSPGVNDDFSAILSASNCVSTTFPTFFKLRCHVFTPSFVAICGSAGTAAYRVNPDYAIVVETTTAADLADVPENKKVCKLGEGAVISFMDRRTIYSRELFDKAFELAKRDGIKAQVKSAVAGGNNAGVIHKTAGGIKTVTVSMPCRYLHSPSCVLKAEDITESERIIRALAEEFADA